MNETKSIGDAIIYGVTQLSDAIKNIAPEYWRIMIKQQYVASLEYVVASLFFIALFVATTIYAKKMWKIWEKDTGYSGNGTELRVVSVLIIIIALGLAICFLTCAVARVINPEYYAIEGIRYMVS